MKAMAWMRMMGADSVAYHRATVMGRADDYAGRALSYYASRGETPLVWGGSGVVTLGLGGAVAEAHYDALYGQGGARHPDSGARLSSTRRPGMELVIAAHKSVAELGVIGRAEDMHAIMDAERDATLSYLDQLTQERGGRRGQDAEATPTSGLVYCHTRHATSRAGDPAPHDHVLVANLVAMQDARGGFKAADTALWREHLHAATMVGRLAAAKCAVDLGYAIEADPGPSGRLGHWRIKGMPEEVCDLHSKRAAEITAACRARGESSYQARAVAARETRKAKRFEGEGELLPRWRVELEDAGWPIEQIVSSVDAAAEAPRPSFGPAEIRRIHAEVLAADGELARRKVFSRRHVVVALAPHLFGADPELLSPFCDFVLADPETVPLIGVQGARERPFVLASVIGRELAIADAIDRQLARTDAACTRQVAPEAAISAFEATSGICLSVEQRQAAIAICTSNRGAEIVVGVAGSGKTTMLDCVRSAFEISGFAVYGTATAGQAAKTLERDAHISSCTLASLLWRIDHDQITLTERCVVICDEAAMTDDADLLRLAAHTEATGAKLVVVGDHRQLAAVGPGGALASLVERHRDAVHVLSENRRQHDPQERAALAELRSGNVVEAVSFYRQADRIHAATSRDETIAATVAAWGSDITANRRVGLYAFRRANVAALNHAARSWMEATGRLSGPELACPGGMRLRRGDRVVAITPGPKGTLSTSEQATVEDIDTEAAVATLMADDGRRVELAAQDAGADRLSYGFATTVHRSQGVTVDRAHVFFDGGGRELAYVAMSRAREESHVHVAADDADQAEGDLRDDWSRAKAPTWAIDLGEPDPDHGFFDGPERARAAAIRFAADDAALDAAERAVGADLTAQIAETEKIIVRYRRDLDDLKAGRGVYARTEAATALEDLRWALAQRDKAAKAVTTSTSRRDRKAAARGLPACQEEVDTAKQRWTEAVTPEAERLTGTITAGERTLARLVARQEHHNAAADRMAEQISTLRRNRRSLRFLVREGRERLAGSRRGARRISFVEQRERTPQIGEVPSSSARRSLARGASRIAM